MAYGQRLKCSYSLFTFWKMLVFDGLLYQFTFGELGSAFFSKDHSRRYGLEEHWKHSYDVFRFHCTLLLKLRLQTEIQIDDDGMVSSSSHL